MPKGLRPFHGGGDFHFIMCSCYRRLQFLGSARRRDLFLKILEEVRQKYSFIVAGYVVIHAVRRKPRAPGPTPSISVGIAARELELFQVN